MFLKESKKDTFTVEMLQSDNRRNKKRSAANLHGHYVFSIELCSHMLKMSKVSKITPFAMCFIQMWKNMLNHEFVLKIYDK